MVSVDWTALRGPAAEGSTMSRSTQVLRRFGLALREA